MQKPSERLAKLITRSMNYSKSNYVIGLADARIGSTPAILYHI